MRNFKIFRVLSIEAKLCFTRLADVLRLGVLLLLAAVSFVPASAQSPANAACLAGEICEADDAPDQITHDDKSQKNQIKTIAKPWIKVDEPANFALLAMGIIGLLVGRWAARHRAVKPDKE